MLLQPSTFMSAETFWMKSMFYFTSQSTPAACNDIPFLHITTFYTRHKHLGHFSPSPTSVITHAVLEHICNGKMWKYTSMYGENLRQTELHLKSKVDTQRWRGEDWCYLQLEKLTKWQGQCNYKAWLIAISIVQLQLPHFLCVCPTNISNVCIVRNVSSHRRPRVTE